MQDCFKHLKNTNKKTEKQKLNEKVLLNTLFYINFKNCTNSASLVELKCVFIKQKTIYETG